MESSIIIGQDEVMEKDRKSVLFCLDERKWMKYMDKFRSALHEGLRPSKFEANSCEPLTQVKKGGSY